MSQIPAIPTHVGLFVCDWDGTPHEARFPGYARQPLGAGPTTWALPDSATPEQCNAVMFSRLHETWGQMVAGLMLFDATGWIGSRRFERGDRVWQPGDQLHVRYNTSVPQLKLPSVELYGAIKTGRTYLFNDDYVRPLAVRPGSRGHQIINHRVGEDVAHERTAPLQDFVWQARRAGEFDENLRWSP